MRILSIFGIAFILLAGCVNQPARVTSDQGPTNINPFAYFYFECPRCGSLDGGCFGKNSVSSWRSEAGLKCRHKWQEIEKAEFDRKWQEEAGSTSHY